MIRVDVTAAPGNASVTFSDGQVYRLLENSDVLHLGKDAKGWFLSFEGQPRKGTSWTAEAVAADGVSIVPVSPAAGTV
jgi:hypothetical protein